ncbi:MAG: enoyl-CoA hydratase/isomerase family protein [Betaproteobacteria bacterium]|nr:enoyl-CoA hydratase/isomerase family protein [Betaproteobacteria bacterium]NBO43328.1 enoyl-CoA hydratase/isomerase family protein [Betaproteobacteria bacterium]NBP09768.1 enoyl-CoA hydratase/isomerase family protein [Betaproteobacteria bacterium]NBP61161.1 enoyl-CoA hydratase/isomerase family protein [Betaproteobacteria bacterium]NBQ08040.1 enoyl-CoA hydratase/isomerase family protein [Betaproteobacteria bacterium]
MDLAAVLFDTLGEGPMRIGRARLNRPKQLNGINREMVRLLTEQLRQWRSDTTIAAVIVQAEGEKGFSAGGDVAEVVRQLRAGGPQRFAYGDAFFEEEYILDRLIHRYGKPFIVFSHGINMGGGMGLSAGASHRIIAEGAQVAMPEIHIGLFPDVGGGFFLNRLPPGVGMMMALTGLVLNEADALVAGLFDAFLPKADWNRAIDQLCALSFCESWQHNHDLVSAWMLDHDASRSEAMVSSMLSHYAVALRWIGRQPSPAKILEQLQRAANDDPWFEAPATSLAKGSPTAALISHRYLQEAFHCSLEEVLALDLRLARQFLRQHDFPEGVRALLIDKDRKPQWRYARFDDVPPAYLAAHFEDERSFVKA